MHGKQSYRSAALADMVVIPGEAVSGDGRKVEAEILIGAAEIRHAQALSARAQSNAAALYGRNQETVHHDPAAPVTKLAG